MSRLRPPSWSVFTDRSDADEEGGEWWAAPSNEQRLARATVVGASHLSLPLRSQPPTLVVTDGDATLFREEVIDELACFAGVGEQVVAITAQAMHGNMGFTESLTRRVALLEGLPVRALDQVRESLTLTPGAQALIRWSHKVGAKFGVVSGGFTAVLEPLTQRLGVDHLAANTLEIEDGRLTGRVLGQVVDGLEKERVFAKWADAASGSAVDRAQALASSVAVGDGANDIPMLRSAGLGIAFRAKPAVREAVPSYLDLAQLDAVVGLLGWRPTGSEGE